MVQVDAKMFGVSSTVTLIQPGRKATVTDLHPVIKPSNLHKTSSLALEIKLNNICVTFTILGLVDWWNLVSELKIGQTLCGSDLFGAQKGVRISLALSQFLPTNPKGLTPFGIGPELLCA